MNSLFYGTTYNQNLSNWCVSNISNTPSQFGGSFANNNLPAWGTCPVVQDYTGPAISSIVATVTSLDVTNSPQILTISFRATDTSGVKLNDLGRQGFEMGNNGYNFDNPYVLISGTNKDGTYAASTTLSSSTHPPGNLRLYNKAIKDINDFFSNSFRPDPYNLTVTNYDCSSITPSNGLDVSQTATGIDLNSDGALTAGEAIAYYITVTNSGNTTITGLILDRILHHVIFY